MVRSLGIVAIVVGLAWTGLAGAQSSSPLEKSRYINVSEEGKSPQRCQILKTWREANGAPAFQVQAVDTGELMTIVGTAPQGAGGDPHKMTTRIFRWGRDNKPPAGAPMPPPTAAASTSLPSQPKPVQKPAPVVSQPIRPAPVAAAPRPTPIPQTVQRPNPAPVTTPAQPKLAPNTLTSSKPASPTVAFKPVPVVTTKTPPLTPMSTQVVQYSSPSSQPNQLPDVPKPTASQPRLAPLPSGSAGSPNACNCACSQTCQPSCKPCDACGQSSCVCNTPSPMRQPLIGRLFKSNSTCACTTVASQPPPKPEEKPIAAPPAAPTVVKAATEPAQSGDWRQSWGKVEPWKGTGQTSTVKPVEVSKRADPKAVPMGPSTQPDPLKAPAQYRDLVMNSPLSNSKIPQGNPPSVVAQANKNPPPTWKIGPPPEIRSNESLPPARPGEVREVTQGSPSGRTIAISADEPNAFWSPKSPGSKQETAKLNAFDRQPETPPQAAPPSLAGVPPSLRGVPPSLPGVAIGMMPPPRPPVISMPVPPLPPTAAQRGPVPMMPDSGVPGAMSNAFTLSATSRPIPADFGGTPQEPNGFDPLVRGSQGSPPRAYTMGMGTPGAYRPPMSNMAAMGPQAPMGVNPLMSVAAMPFNGQAVASGGASAPAGGVHQLLTALKDSLRPSEREAAAEQLSELNWRIQPLVVDSLMKSARNDPAATVRAACVHALAQMKVNTPAALAVVRDLRTDRDPHVRQEAEEALNSLGDSGIQQATHK